jgi:putative ABC transport system permease protein
MGYGDSYLVGILLQEALILAILGFIPGFGISLGLYGLITLFCHSGQSKIFTLL